MKKFLVITIVFLVVISASALAAGKLTVTQKSFYVRPFLAYFAGEIYAELKIPVISLSSSTAA